MDHKSKPEQLDCRYRFECSAKGEYLATIAYSGWALEQCNDQCYPRELSFEYNRIQCCWFHWSQHQFEVSILIWKKKTNLFNWLNRITSFILTVVDASWANTMNECIDVFCGASLDTVHTSWQPLNDFSFVINFCHMLCLEKGSSQTYLEMR